MNGIETMIKMALGKTGARGVLNIAENVGFISKTQRKRIGQKIKWCYNEKMALSCKLYCQYGYGSDECKNFRKQNNMKVGNFYSGEDILAKAIESKL